jgi:hypothetical protein
MFSIEKSRQNQACVNWVSSYTCNLAGALADAGARGQQPWICGTLPGALDNANNQPEERESSFVAWV